MQTLNPAVPTAIWCLVSILLCTTLAQVAQRGRW